MISEKKREYQKEYRKNHADYYREYQKQYKLIIQERSKSKRIKKLKERYENAFYYKVYETCIKKGIKHGQLATECGMVENTLRLYLILERDISAKDLVRIARVLRINPAELLETYILALEEKEKG